MNRWLREFRLIPIVIVAAGSLLALKVLGLMLDGSYTLGQRLGAGDTLVVTRVPVAPPVTMRSPATPLPAPADTSQPKLSWMQEMFNYPDITGSVHGAKPKTASAEPPKAADKDGKAPPAANPPETKPADGQYVPMEPTRLPSGAERALLERLQERRKELDARARELDLRESMVKAAEQKLEADRNGQKAAEARDGTPEQRAEKSEAARMKSIVTMYETMKPKDAAKIFDRLDIKVLLEMATQINPRRMSEILAQMTPEAAERLTVELAARGGAERTVNPATLPKIEGRPAN